MNCHDVTPRATPLTRRGFLRSVNAGAIGLTSLASGCSKPVPEPGKDFRGQTLTVFVYSGLDKIFQKYFVEPFEAKTGATIVLDAGWWDSIGKLKASPKGEPAYDLVLADATQGYPAIKSGMFRQLDFEKIPNRRELAPVALDNWVAKERYGVTFHESAMSLVWDRHQLDFEPASWGDLLRDNLRKKISLYDSFYFSLYAFACMKAAADGKTGTASQSLAGNLDGVLEFAKRERDRVRFWWPTGTKMLQDLLQGNFAAGNAHSVTLLEAVKEKPDVVGFVTPPADRAYVQLMWVVPADTPNAELAEAAIDFLLSQPVQAAIARAGMGTSHAAAAREVAAADANWAKTYPHTDEQFRTMRYFPYEAYFKDWDRIKKVWEQEVLRKT
jgi:putative spermidine/putrescine transport system substrate-binding protein